MEGGDEIMASKKVDKRIVQMDFDNAKFERGVQTTLKSISKLKSSLKFDGASKSLKELENASGKVNLRGLSNAIGLIEKRFSTFGIISTTVLQELTKTAMNAGSRIANALTGQIISGGKTRALNIEQAKFMFEGLGMDIEKSMASANAAVKGTAYGLDQAAKAAGQFGASGMRAGDEMTSALRGIAGVASMTSSDYDEIANVFTQVAGQGRLMGDQLLQLSQRGINVAATLADQLGMTEKEVRELVSDGQISFETFYKAMDNAFGKQAKKANKTFTGALSNMRAALSRIGADVATPGIENLRKTINSLTPVIDNVHAALMPLIGSIEKTLVAAGKKARKALEGIDQKSLNQIGKGLNNLYTSAGKVFTFIGGALGSFKDGLDAVLPSISALDFKNVTKSIKDFASSLKLSDEAAEKFKMVGSSLGNVIASIKNIASAFASVARPAIEGVLDAIIPLKDSLGSLVPGGLIQTVYDITSKFREFTEGLTVSDETAESIRNTFKSVFTIFAGGINIITNIAKVIGGALLGSLNLLSPVGKVALDVLKSIGSVLLKMISSSIGPVSKGIKGLSSALTEFSKNVKNSLENSELLKNIMDGLKSGVNTVLAAFEKLGGIVSGLLGGALGGAIALFTGFSNKIKDAGNTFDSSSKTISTSFSTIDSSATNTRNGLVIFVNTIKSVFGKIMEFISPFTNMIKRVIDQINLDDILNVASMGTGLKIFKSIENVFKQFSGLNKAMEGVGSALKSVSGVLKEYQKDIKADIIKKIAVSVALLAASIVALSMVNPNNLVTGFAAMSSLLAELVIAVKAVSDLKVKENDILKISASMIVVAGALNIMASALNKLDGYKDIGSIAPSLLGIATLLGSITIAMKALIKEMESTTKDNLGGEMIKVGASMILIATALNVLASACNKLGSMDLGSLVKGTAAIGVLMLSLSKFKNIYSDGSYAGMALVIMAIATSMLILHKAIVKFAGIPYEEMQTGLGRVKTILMGLFLFLKGIENANMEGVAATIVAVSVALNLLLVPIKVLGAMDLPTLVQGLIATGAALAGFVIALQSLDNVKISGGTAAAILALSVALTLLVVPITALGVLPWQVVALGITALVGSLALLGGIMAVLSPVASGMLMVSAAFAAFGGAIALIGGGVLAFAAGLTLLATSSGLTTAALMAFLAVLPAIVAQIGTVLQAVASMAPGIGESLKTIGVTIVQVLGEIAKEIATQLVQILGTIVKTLAEQIIQNGPIVVTAIGTVVRSLIDEITKTIPNIVNLGVTFITEFAKGFAKASSQVVKSGVTIVKNVLKGIQQVIPEFVQTGVTFITELLKGIEKTVPQLMKTATKIIKEFLKTIRDTVPDIIETGFQILQSLLDGIAKHMKDIVTTAADIVTEFIDGIAEKLPQIIDSGMNLMISFIEGLAKGIDENGDRAVDAVFNLFESIVKLIIKTIGKLPGKLLEWGKKAIKGLIDGFKAFKKNIWPTIKDIIDGIIDRIKHLPGDLLQAGKDAIEGFIKGFKDKINSVKEAAMDIGKTAVDGVKDFLGIHSPSRVLAEVGRNTVAGYVKGLMERQHDVLVASKNLGKPIKDFAEGIVKNMTVGGGAVKQFYNDIKSMNITRKEFNKEIKNMALSMDAFTKSLYRNSEYYKEDINNTKELKKNYADLKKEEKELRKEQGERLSDLKKAQAEVAKSRAEEKKEREKEKSEKSGDDPILARLEARMKKTKETDSTVKVVGGSISKSVKKVTDVVKKSNEEQTKSDNKTTETKKKNAKEKIDLDTKTTESTKKASTSRKKSADSEKKSYEETTKKLQENLKEQEKARKQFAENEKKIIENQKKALKDWQDGIKETIKNYTDLANLNFETGLNLTEAFTIDTSVTTADALKNSSENLKAYKKWLKDLEKLSAMGYDDAIVKTVKDAGYQNQTYLNSLMGATKDEVKQFNKDMRESQKLSADQVIRDAKERMELVQKWSTNIQKMSLMGFSQGLIRSLVESGPEATAELVNVYANMTKAQAKEITQFENNTEKAIKEATNRVTYSVALSGATASSKSAKSFVNGYTKEIKVSLGKESSKAAKQGLTVLENDIDKNSSAIGKKSGKKLVGSFIKGVKDESKNTEKAGEDISKNFAKGLSSVTTVEESENMFTAKILTEFKESGEKVGEAVGDGVAEGVEKSSNTATEAVESFYDKIKSSVETFVDPLKVSASTGIDIFKEFTVSSELTAQQLLTNMQSQVEGLRQWKSDLNSLAADGLAPELINKLRDLGVSSAEQIRAFKEMTTAEIQSANTAMTEALKLSAEQVLEEQKRKTEEALKWSEDMAKLAGKGISEGLIKGLAEQGVDGSSEMLAAYLTMTPQQIAELNANYEAALQVPSKVADAIDKNYSTAGSTAVKQFANAVGTIQNDNSNDKETINAAMEVVSQEVHDNTTESFFETGKESDKELATSINKYKNEPTEAARKLSSSVYSGLTSNLNYSSGSSIAWDIIEGLVSGIRNGTSTVVNEIVSMAVAAVEAAREELEINSPSKKFIEIGKFTARGLAKGIKDNTSNVTKETLSMTDQLINAAQEAIDKANLSINQAMDMSPTIRPVIDIDKAIEGVKKLNNELTKRSVLSMEREVGIRDSRGRSTAATSQTTPTVDNTYNFVQNNYSPEALSRIDIYRQSKSLFSQFRRAVDNA